MATKTWYDIRATANDEAAEVFIYDAIGSHGVTPQNFIADLKAHEGKAVTLRIHSAGGSVNDGNAIYNALKRHRGGVTTQIDGFAASMATVIALAGAPVRMAQNAWFVIHNPWTTMAGEAQDLRRSADILDRMRKSMADIYMIKTGKEPEEIERMMDDETWLTAREAQAAGFVDEITDEIEAAASIDVSKYQFRNVPQALTSISQGMEATALQAEITRLNAELTAANALIAEQEPVNAELVKLRETFAARENTINELTASLASKDAEIEALNASLKALEAANPSAEMRAAQIVAGLGIDPVLAASSEQASMNELEMFLSLKGPEQTAYFRKHQARIRELQFNR